MFFLFLNKKILAVVLATIGAILSLRTLENSFDNNHQRLGLALYAAMWLQFLTGVFKPSRYIYTRNIYIFFMYLYIYKCITLVAILLDSLIVEGAKGG